METAKYIMVTFLRMTLLGWWEIINLVFCRVGYIFRKWSTKKRVLQGVLAILSLPGSLAATAFVAYLIFSRTLPTDNFAEDIYNILDENTLWLIIGLIWYVLMQITWFLVARDKKEGKTLISKLDDLAYDEGSTK